MKFRTWVTPLTGGAFFLMAVTGLLLFFELGSVGLVKVAHEWLSLVFVGGALFHLIFHFKAFKNHLKSFPGRVLVFGFVALTLVTLLPLGHSEENDGPSRGNVQAMLAEAPLGVLAQVAKRPLEEVVADLSSAGMAGLDPLQSLAQQVKPGGKSVNELLGIVLAKSPVRETEEDEEDEDKD
jgi:hypothetical protein